jgi:hypothetical protein
MGSDEHRFLRKGGETLVSTETGGGGKLDIPKWKIKGQGRKQSFTVSIHRAGRRYVVERPPAQAGRLSTA